MSSSENINHVSQNEGDNLEMEGNNEDKCNIEEEDDDNLESDTSVEVDREVFFEFLAECGIMLSICRYGNCPRCFRWSVIGLKCPITRCNSTIVNIMVRYGDNSYALNPLFISIMLSKTSILMSGLCNPHERVPSNPNDEEWEKMLIVENIPSDVIPKAHQILKAIIHLDRNKISDDDKKWLMLVGKMIVMEDTNQFGEQETHTSQNPYV